MVFWSPGWESTSTLLVFPPAGGDFVFHTDKIQCGTCLIFESVTINCFWQFSVQPQLAPLVSAKLLMMVVGVSIIIIIIIDDHLSIWSNISCMVFWTTRYWSIANCGFTDWGISTGSTLVVGKWKHWFTKYRWGLRWSWWWEYDYNDFEDRPCGKQGDCQPVLTIAQHHTIDLCREIIRPRTEIIFPTLEIIF